MDPFQDQPERRSTSCSYSISRSLSAESPGQYGDTYMTNQLRLYGGCSTYCSFRTLLWGTPPNTISSPNTLPWATLKLKPCKIMRETQFSCCYAHFRWMWLGSLEICFHMRRPNKGLDCFCTQLGPFQRLERNRNTVTWVWLKIKELKLRRFWSLFP